MPNPGDPVRADDIFDLNTFTPVWTNVTLGTTGLANEGWYQQIGEMVLWGFRLELGTGGGFSSTINLDLPVPAYVGGGLSLQNTIGAWTMRRPSPALHYSGSIGIWSGAGTSCSFAGAWTGSAPSTRINASSPLGSVTAGDVLTGSGCYRAA
jgi:hypothetical protein